MRTLATGFLLIALAAPAAAQIDPSTALLAQTGWNALAAGQPHAAAEAFHRALTADPRNARLHLGAALAAFAERLDADAKDFAERALALDPALADARALLGQVLYRLGDLDGAIRTYETLAGEIHNPDVVAALDRWRRERDLHDSMQQAVGAHFTVSFDGPVDDLVAAEALASLDRAYWRIGGMLGTLPSEPIPVVLYTSAQFHDITRAPSWAAGAYDGTIRVPMGGARDHAIPQPELDRVLAHEFTHAIVRSLAKGHAPTWLNEGLATALETDDPGWANERVRRAGGLMPLDRLQDGFGHLTAAEAPLAYATSALVVTRMLDLAGGYAVANLLRDLGDGVPFADAFLHRMQRSVADITLWVPTPETSSP